jgi:hypothetical protein
MSATTEKWLISEQPKMTRNIPYQDSLQKLRIGAPDMYLTVHANVGRDYETKHDTRVPSCTAIVLYRPSTWSHYEGVE